MSKFIHSAKEVAKLLQDGHVVAFPTDTVYGLACDSYNKQAIQKLRDLKNRDRDKPLPMMVDSLATLQKVAYLNDFQKRICDMYMPGAFTVVVKAKNLPDFTSHYRDTIAIRIPDNKFVLEVLRQLEHPLLVTSANIANGENTITHTQVLNQLPNLEYIVPGESGSFIASTIVDLTGDDVQIIRQGEVYIK